MISDLGYFENYGHIIISLCLIWFGLWYTFLGRDYIDD